MPLSCCTQHVGRDRDLPMAWRKLWFAELPCLEGQCVPDKASPHPTSPHLFVFVAVSANSGGSCIPAPPQAAGWGTGTEAANSFLLPARCEREEGRQTPKPTGTAATRKEANFMSWSLPRPTGLTIQRYSINHGTDGHDCWAHKVWEWERDDSLPQTGDRAMRWWAQVGLPWMSCHFIM